MNAMIITTTNKIENNSIRQYLAIVNANIVIGTNFISDIEASLTDFWGGRSDTYQNKLNIIYEKAINELKKKAYALNADAIVGLRIDFDEISGNNKSMFMVSASGTAVLLEDTFCEDRYAKYRKLDEIHNYFTKGFLSEEEYNYEKKRIIEIYNSPLSHEIEKIKEVQEYEEKVKKEKEELETHIKEAKLEEARKTFVFDAFKTNN